METMVSISVEQAYSISSVDDDVMRSLAREGSIGKAVIRRPSGVMSPRLERAPSAQRSKSDVVMVSWGGGSMKEKSRRSRTPRDLRRRTVLARLVRWISGMVWM